MVFSRYQFLSKSNEITLGRIGANQNLSAFALELVNFSNWP